MDVRTQAAIVLGKLLRQQGSLATLLPEAVQAVPTKDKALLRELCYGVCRWYPRLELLIQQLVHKPLRAKDADIQALIALGLYQLMYLRVPDHAALSATVEAAQVLKKVWAKKFINGVLRQFLRERANLEQHLQSNPVFVSAHPSWLIEIIRDAYPENFAAIVNSNNHNPPFTLRVNTQKISRVEYLALLTENKTNANTTPISEFGVTIEHAVDVADLPGFSDGLVSVQDEAPQLCANLLNCQPNYRVLDACCAPGGKTAHLLELFPDLSLVALDISEQRLQRTRDNLQRLHLQADLKVGDASQPSSWWDGQAFDRILLDAPCSATGIIRRQPDIKILRTPESLTKLVDTQWRLLNALWPLLKRGGELLYATCSILPQENEDIIERFIREQPDAICLSINADWGISQHCGCQLLPHIDGHDGFYFARLQKGPSL